MSKTLAFVLHNCELRSEHTKNCFILSPTTAGILRIFFYKMAPIKHQVGHAIVTYESQRTLLKSKSCSTSLLPNLKQKNS